MKHPKAHSRRIDFLPYLLLAPAFLLLTVLVFYPILVTFVFSLKKMKLTAPNDSEWIGFEHYLSLLQDSQFWYALQNTMTIVVLVVVLCMVGGMIVALMLRVDSKIKHLLTAIAILPWALPPVVNGILWKWIFYPGFGFVNKLLIEFQLIQEPIQWLSQRWPLMGILSLVVAWRNIPFCAIIFLAAMQAIPKEIYEAADIDGASSFQTFRKLTLPLLLPASGIVITSTSITAINVFDEIVSLSGYSNLGKTLLIEDYLTTFSFLDFGRGSALAYLIMLLAAVLGIFYIRNLYREVNYQ